MARKGGDRKGGLHRKRGGVRGPKTAHPPVDTRWRDPAQPRPRGTRTPDWGIEPHAPAQGDNKPDWGIEPHAPAQDQAPRTGSQLHPLPRDGEPEAGAAPSKPADTFSVPPYILERHSRADQCRAHSWRPDCTFSPA